MTQAASQPNPVSQLVRSLAGILFYIYFLIAFLIATPYFNWKFASEHGFASWLFFGEVAATGKAIIWPYYAITGSNSFPPLLWPVLMVVVLGIGALVLNGLARWVATKGPIPRNVLAFCLAGVSTYSASFLLTIWIETFRGRIPPENIVWPTITWLVLTIIFTRAALLTAAFAYSVAMPFFLCAVLSGLVAFLPSLPQESRGCDLAIAIGLSVIGVVIVSNRKSSPGERVQLQQAYS